MLPFSDVVDTLNTHPPWVDEGPIRCVAHCSVLPLVAIVRPTYMIMFSFSEEGGWKCVAYFPRRHKLLYEGLFDGTRDDEISLAVWNFDRLFLLSRSGRFLVLDVSLSGTKVAFDDENGSIPSLSKISHRGFFPCSQSSRSTKSRLDSVYEDVVRPVFSSVKSGMEEPSDPIVLPERGHASSTRRVSIHPNRSGKLDFGEPLCASPFGSNGSLILVSFRSRYLAVLSGTNGDVLQSFRIDSLSLYLPSLRTGEDSGSFISFSVDISAPASTDIGNKRVPGSVAGPAGHHSSSYSSPQSSSSSTSASHPSKHSLASEKSPFSPTSNPQIGVIVFMHWKSWLQDSIILIDETNNVLFLSKRSSSHKILRSSLHSIFDSELISSLNDNPAIVCLSPDNVSSFVTSDSSEMGEYDLFDVSCALLPSASNMDSIPSCLSVKSVSSSTDLESVWTLQHLNLSDEGLMTSSWINRVTFVVECRIHRFSRRFRYLPTTSSCTAFPSSPLNHDLEKEEILSLQNDGWDVLYFCSLPMDRLLATVPREVSRNESRRVSTDESFDSHSLVRNSSPPLSSSLLGEECVPISLQCCWFPRYSRASLQTGNPLTVSDSASSPPTLAFSVSWCGQHCDEFATLSECNRILPLPDSASILNPTTFQLVAFGQVQYSRSSFFSCWNKIFSRESPFCCLEPKNLSPILVSTLGCTYFPCTRPENSWQDSQYCSDILSMFWNTSATQLYVLAGNAHIDALHSSPFHSRRESRSRHSSSPVAVDLFDSEPAFSSRRVSLSQPQPRLLFTSPVRDETSENRSNFFLFSPTRLRGRISKVRCFAVSIGSVRQDSSTTTSIGPGSFLCSCDSFFFAAPTVGRISLPLSLTKADVNPQAPEVKWQCLTFPRASNGFTDALRSLRVRSCLSYSNFRSFPSVVNFYRYRNGQCPSSVVLFDPHIGLAIASTTGIVALTSSSITTFSPRVGLCTNPRRESSSASKRKNSDSCHIRRSFSISGNKFILVQSHRSEASVASAGLLTPSVLRSESLSVHGNLLHLWWKIEPRSWCELLPRAVTHHFLHPSSSHESGPLSSLLMEKPIESAVNVDVVHFLSDDFLLIRHVSRVVQSSHSSFGRGLHASSSTYLDSTSDRADSRNIVSSFWSVTRVCNGSAPSRRHICCSLSGLSLPLLTHSVIPVSSSSNLSFENQGFPRRSSMVVSIYEHGLLECFLVGGIQCECQKDQFYFSPSHVTSLFQVPEKLNKKFSFSCQHTGRIRDVEQIRISYRNQTIDRIELFIYFLRPDGDLLISIVHLSLSYLEVGSEDLREGRNNCARHLSVHKPVIVLPPIRVSSFVDRFWSFSDVVYEELFEDRTVFSFLIHTQNPSVSPLFEHEDAAESSVFFSASASSFIRLYVLSYQDLQNSENSSSDQEISCTDSYPTSLLPSLKCLHSAIVCELDDISVPIGTADNSRALQIYRIFDRSLKSSDSCPSVFLEEQSFQKLPYLHTILQKCLLQSSADRLQYVLQILIKYQFFGNNSFLFSSLEWVLMNSLLSVLEFSLSDVETCSLSFARQRSQTALLLEAMQSLPIYHDVISHCYRKIDETYRSHLSVMLPPLCQLFDNAVMSENYHAASCLLVALRDEFGPTISCVLASVLLRFVMTHLIRSTSEDCTLMLSLLGSGFPQLSSINTHFRGSDHISLHPLLVSISILFDEKENSSDPFFTCSCKWLSLDSSPVEALMPIESYLTDDAIIREIDLVLPSLQLVSGLVKFIVQCIAAFSESEVNDDLCSKYSELFLSLDLSAGLHGLTAREFSSNLFAMCKKLQGSSFTSSPSFAPSPASMLFCEIFSDFSRSVPDHSRTTRILATLCIAAWECVFRCPGEGLFSRLYDRDLEPILLRSFLLSFSPLFEPLSNRTECFSAMQSLLSTLGISIHKMYQFSVLVLPILRFACFSSLDFRGWMGAPSLAFYSAASSDLFLTIAEMAQERFISTQDENSFQSGSSTLELHRFVLILSRLLRKCCPESNVLAPFLALSFSFLNRWDWLVALLMALDWSLFRRWEQRVTSSTAEDVVLILNSTDELVTSFENRGVRVDDCAEGALVLSLVHFRNRNSSHARSSSVWGGSLSPFVWSLVHLEPSLAVLIDTRYLAYSGVL